MTKVSSPFTRSTSEWNVGEPVEAPYKTPGWLRSLIQSRRFPWRQSDRQSQVNECHRVKYAPTTNDTSSLPSGVEANACLKLGYSSTTNGATGILSDTSDAWWLATIEDIATLIDFDKTIEVLTQDPPQRRFDQDCKLWAKHQAFDRTKPTGIGVGTLQKIIANKDRDISIRELFSAEGQMMRCMFRERHHANRKTFFQIWIIVVSRIDNVAVIRPVQLLHELQEIEVAKDDDDDEAVLPTVFRRVAKKQFEFCNYGLWWCKVFDTIFDTRSKRYPDACYDYNESDSSLFAVSPSRLTLLSTSDMQIPRKSDNV